MNPETKYNFYSDFGAACLFSLFNVVFNQFYIALAIRQGATNFEVGILAAAPAIGLLFSPIWAGMIEQSSPMLGEKRVYKAWHRDAYGYG